MATTNTSRFWIDPAEWMRSWQTVWLPLVQPILPGWSFLINSNNSTAPQTEMEVVAKYSYGRQIGRMSEALELLIEEGHGKTPKEKRFTDFLTMKRDINKLKLEAASTRVEQITKDLTLLKVQDKGQYLRLRDALRKR
jgi:hypothetical protein